MKHLFFWTFLVAHLTVGNAAAQQMKLTITITAGKHDYKNTPVVVPLSVPEEMRFATLERFREPRYTFGSVQLTAPQLSTEAISATAANLVRRDLHFVLPSLKAGQTAKLVVTLSDRQGPPNGTFRPPTFRWVDRPEQFSELFYGNRPVLRYMDMPYDSNPRKRVFNYKVFHHLYDPEGKFFVTNGGETDYPMEPKRKLLFPHHRGLMYAFNKITYNGKTVDTWHAKPGDTHQEHVKVLSEEAGPLLGRHRVLVDWHGKDNEVFAKEERELTVYHMPAGTLVEFASRLKTVDGPIKLAGDPQHAGFQFRARQDVADQTAKQTYYLRPDGKGELDETRNWDPKTKQGPVNLPWNAMSFVLNDKRYTVAYLDRPTNPRESRWSERDYGRFGNYFEYELTKEHPLLVDYLIWLQEGEMTGAQVKALSTEFVTPPEVSVK
jgi:hypothetical protein